MNNPVIRTTRNHQTILAFFGVLLLTASGAYGSVFKSGDNISISNLHVIDDDLFVYGNQFDLDGTIDGDLLGFVYRSTIRGQVSSSAALVCRFLNHQGTIDGSLRACGEDLAIDGIIGRSAELIGSQVSLGSGSIVERDVNAFGGVVHLDGAIRGKTLVRAGTVCISGQIEDDVDIEADRIEISPSAIINGNLTYSTKQEDDLEIASGADIHGETVWRARDIEEESGVTGISFNISAMLAAFIFGIIVVRLFRPYAEESFSQLRDHYVTAFAAGLLGLLGLGLSLVILAISLLSFGTALAILSSETPVILGVLFLVFSTLAIPISTFASITGSIVYYCGIIIVAFLIGFLIISLLKRDNRSLSSTSLFIGLLVLLIAFSLPWVGILLYFICAVAGAGGIFMGIRRCRRARPPEKGTEPIVESPSPANGD
jgi:cytoskeletal protein CcmA (bactofilin family)